MSRVSKLKLPFADWPADDQRLWTAAFEAGDRFEACGRGAHLAASTREMLYERYAHFLRFVSVQHRNLLTRPADERIDRRIVAEFVAWRRKSCSDMTVSIELRCLRDALALICPDADLSWLLVVARRIAATAPRRTQRYNLITSDRLYALGIALMDGAVADTDAAQRVRTRDAYVYRDGLMIALLALIPLRRRTLTTLKIGQHLVRSGDLWALDIPAADTKARRPLDYPISKELSVRIDVYLERFRCRIPGANTHTGLWASHLGGTTCAPAIGATVRKRTRSAFGFGVSPHRFRHAAASFWAIHDPVNVRGTKDLLGHASLLTTEKHYIMAQSRLAGRALAHAVHKLRRVD
jgi:integrase/recombinase XerD